MIEQIAQSFDEDEDPEPPGCSFFESNTNNERAHAADEAIQALIGDIEEVTAPSDPTAPEKYLFMRQVRVGNFTLQSLGFFGDSKRDKIAKQVRSERGDPRIATIYRAPNNSWEQEKFYSVNYSTYPIDYMGDAPMQRYVVRELATRRATSKNARSLVSEKDMLFQEGTVVDQAVVASLRETVRCLRLRKEEEDAADD